MDSISNGYAIVEFIKEQSIEAIPKSWLSADNTTARWPKIQSTAKVQKMIFAETTLSNDDCIIMDIRKLGEAGI